MPQTRRHSLRILAIASALLAALFGPGAQVPAGAVTCSEQNPCFAEANWAMYAPAGTLGAKVTLRSNCMGLANLTQDSLTQSLSVGDRDTDQFVQIGYMRGYNPYGSDYSTPRRFFLYENTVGTYFTASQFNYSYGTALTATAYKSSTSSSTWQLWFGNSTNHLQIPYMFSGAAEFMTAGTRSNDTGSDTYGSASSLYFYNLGATITPNWAGTTSHSNVYHSGSPMDADWAATYWWARMGQNGQC